MEFFVSSEWWYLQAIVSAGVALAFFAEGIRAIRWRLKKDTPNSDHGIVTSLSLMVIAVGNVFTSMATGLNDDGMRNLAGVCIRAVLVVLAVYYFVLDPHNLDEFGLFRRFSGRREPFLRRRRDDTLTGEPNKNEGSRHGNA